MPYEVPLTAWKQPPPALHDSASPSAGYYGSEAQKADSGEREGPGILELQQD